jgi:dienelactone hydrolase
VVGGIMKTLITLYLLTVTLLSAAVRTESVIYKDGDQELEGFVAWDDTVTGARPGVLVVHDWTGLQDYAKDRAKMLAALGYVAFAADVYGRDVRPVDPKECAVCAGKYRNDLPLLRRRVLAAVDQLKSRKECDPQRLGAIGYCFGGTCVLELARSGADVRGVVSFHGGLGTKLPAEPGAIKARILVCHGGADDKVNLEVPAFQEEMKKSQAKMEFITYEGAKHGFTKPGAAWQEKADKESWAAMEKFFKEVFAAK